MIQSIARDIDPSVPREAVFDQFLGKDVHVSPTIVAQIELGLSRPSSLGPSGSRDTTLALCLLPQVVGSGGATF